jgi:hypothetical protein
MDKIEKNIIVTKDEFIKIFSATTYDMTNKDIFYRKDELLKIVKDMKSEFAKNLVKIDDSYKKSEGKGEIQVILGERIYFTYFNLESLEEMKNNSSGGLKESIEYSLKRAMNQDKSYVSFAIWDRDGRVYLYKYFKDNKHFDSNFFYLGETTNLKLQKEFNRLMKLNFADITKFIELTYAMIDEKGMGCFWITFDKNSTSWKGMELDWIILDGLQEILKTEIDIDMKTILQRIQTGLIKSKKMKNLFVFVITDYHGKTYDIYIDPNKYESF